MDIVVNEELKAYIDPLTPDEYEALERSLLAEGCRDALVLWGDLLIDGHNRYGICKKHNLPFQTVQNTRFQSIEDVHLWMIDQHLGRRSLSDFQRGVLALRKREIVAERRARQAPPAQAPESAAAAPGEAAAAPAAPAEEALSTREALARAARLRSNQVQLIEKIQQSAAPEVVEAVKAGTLSLSAAAAVATLPAEEQVAAATAGKDELKQAAKRVREAKRKPPREKADAADDTSAGAVSEGTSAGASSADEELTALRKRVAELQAENTKLNQEVATLRKQVLNLLGPAAKPPGDVPAAASAAGAGVDESDPPF